MVAHGALAGSLSCDVLKKRIESQIHANHSMREVRVVMTGETQGIAVLGSCEGGTKRVVYSDASAAMASGAIKERARPRRVAIETLSQAEHAELDTGVVGDVNWCFDPYKKQSLRELAAPLDRTICQGILIGSFYLPQITAAFLAGTQSDWANTAATYSCAADHNSQQIAIGLIAACQCHNPGVVNKIKNDHVTVIHALRRRGGCDKAGIPIF